MVRAVIAFLATIWVVLLAAAPAASLGVSASGIVYAFGSLICHQRPERSFHIGLAQLPVCARCYGLYLGAAIGAIFVASGFSRKIFSGGTSGFSRKISPQHLRHAILVSAVPTAVTWSLEVLGLWDPSNVTRFIAALPLGAAVALTVNYVECARPPRIRSTPPRTHI
jgi:uncharacterized membrane protein